MTGLRPVQVTGYETPNMPFMRELGNAAGTLGLEIITLENGALFKSLQFNMKHTTHISNYQLNGTKGAFKDLGDSLATYIETPGKLSEGTYETYTPKHVIPEGEGSGHGGGDFYTTHYFIQTILGDEEAKRCSIDVYTAVDMCIPGTLGFISISQGNKPIAIPNLRNKEERDAYRNDTRCTFPDIAGDQYIPNNIYGDPEIPDEVYKNLLKKREEKILGKLAAAKEGVKAAERGVIEAQREVRLREAQLRQELNIKP